MSEFLIIIVDDEPNILKTLSRALRLENYAVMTCETAEKALETLERHPADLMLIDVKLPGMDGLELLTRVKAAWSDMPIIMMSGHGTIETAVEATRKGAYSFIEKPLSTEKILITIGNALQYCSLQRENVALRQVVEVKHQMLGQSPVMQELLQKIAVTAPTSGRVLITGENGTGKELVARAIHTQSTRAERPFIKINCAAVPNELIESELFGHEKGSFTGAIRTRKGKFELSNNGTLFLDEIGDMPLEMQAKLLRVLQEGEFERVGGTETLRVDVRVIAASNKDLLELINQGSFRQDLYYRLNVVPLTVPPLRERVEDIAILARLFLDDACHEHGKTQRLLGPDAMIYLQRYDWPGNVRELKNIIERLVILVPSETIGADDLRHILPLNQSSNTPLYDENTPLRVLVQSAERAIILEALDHNRWHISKTARKLQIERSHLYKKIKQLNIPLKSEGD
ncbi:sigma-54-dependent Fis family transcriptional regulator [bacterium]|nr:sigma-54-dependent Fis family transcriptional regulator [bacterium]